jgi:hypothetical protein
MALQLLLVTARQPGAFVVVTNVHFADLIARELFVDMPRALRRVRRFPVMPRSEFGFLLCMPPS